MQQAPFLRNEVEMEAARSIVDVMNKTDWDREQKLNFLQKIDSDLKLELESKKKHQSWLNGKLAALDSFMAWAQSDKEFQIEKNDCSRLHKLRQASIDEMLLLADRENIEISEKVNETDLLTYEMQSFVVLHDWAGALGELEDGEINLPYERCAFEFRISGKTIIALAIGNGRGIITFTECGAFWVCSGAYIDPTDEKNTVMQICMRQIKAICIALDADVATQHIERASSALNKKREASGKIPLNDYHVVNLSKRRRIANPSNGAGEHGKVRLHFRRGHWRHYENTKTWIKWCLVGNPDLGFIKKHYSL